MTLPTISKASRVFSTTRATFADGVLSNVGALGWSVVHQNFPIGQANIQHTQHTAPLPPCLVCVKPLESVSLSTPPTDCLIQTHRNSPHAPPHRGTPQECHRETNEAPRPAHSERSRPSSPSPDAYTTSENPHQGHMHASGNAGRHLCSNSLAHHVFGNVLAPLGGSLVNVDLPSTHNHTAKHAPLMPPRLVNGKPQMPPFLHTPPTDLFAQSHWLTAYSVKNGHASGTSCRSNCLARTGIKRPPSPAVRQH